MFANGILQFFAPNYSDRTGTSSCAKPQGLGKKRNLTNLHVYQNAIHTERGKEVLRKPAGEDFGKASLLKTVGPSEEIANVNVVRLSDILKSHKVTGISFLKVDTQGADLSVLESMDEFLPLVMAGMIEAPSQNHRETYYSSEPSLEKSLRFLRVAGFNVYHISPNDPEIRNVNIFFCRPWQSPEKFEKELNLGRVPLYASYKFWNINSSFRLDNFFSWVKAIWLRILGRRL